MTRRSKDFSTHQIERERERNDTLCVLKYKWCDERENNTRSVLLSMRSFFLSFAARRLSSSISRLVSFDES